MGSQFTVTVVLCNRVHVCGIPVVNRITLLFLGNAPAIMNAVYAEAYQKAGMNVKMLMLT